MLKKLVKMLQLIKKSAYVIYEWPQRAMSLVPFQVQMPPDQALFSQVASIVDRLPVGQLISECLFDFLKFQI